MKKDKIGPITVGATLLQWLGKIAAAQCIAALCKCTQASIFGLMEWNKSVHVGQHRPSPYKCKDSTLYCDGRRGHSRVPDLSIELPR